MYQFNGSLEATKENADKLANILLEDSKEEHDNSLKLDSVKSLISQAMPLLDGIPSGGQELSVLGGHGII